MNRLRASIVLPNLNGAGWLEGCLQSLYAQTVQDFEIILIDNASTDESLATARCYAARENFTLIENKTNTGFSAAVNEGIRRAKAPYVLLFNNDAFAAPDMLAQLLLAMEADACVFGVQCLILRHDDPARVDTAGDYVTLLGWAFQSANALPAAPYTNARPRRVFSACGGAALYRKAVFEEMGLFEGHFFAYLEDVDVGWRANSLGYKNILCPAAVCTHIGGATFGGAEGARYNNFKSVQSGRNSLLLPCKNMPALMLFVNLPFLLLGYLVKTLVFHLRGFGAPWRKGMREAFALLGRLNKPRFRFKNLPHYLWVQGSLVAATFRFIVWRVRRMFI